MHIMWGKLSHSTIRRFLAGRRLKPHALSGPVFPPGPAIRPLAGRGFLMREWNFDHPHRTFADGAPEYVRHFSDKFCARYFFGHRPLPFEKNHRRDLPVIQSKGR